MITLIVKDRAQHSAKLKYRSFDAAAAHARSVIVPLVADALEELTIDAVDEGVGQQDPAEWKRTVEALCEILRDIHAADHGRVVGAVEDWARLAEDNYGDTWIEWV